MTRLFVPTTGVGNWQALLSDPELHWKRGRSAFELAVSWEAAARRESGMPSDIDADISRGGAAILQVTGQLDEGDDPRPFIAGSALRVWLLGLSSTGPRCPVVREHHRATCGRCCVGQMGLSR